ncbi:MAG TPA: TIGR03067 domain-containing protein [Gemmataceae bacterium]|jgi:uncharacterized protein (TIGR03067 family)|nr:TIGR03067 domain-containing protein [Gemmataceae bacterium]
MRKISLLTSGLLILVLAATGRCQTQGSVAELPKITGTWDVVGGEIEGQRLNEVKLAGTRIVVEGDMIRLTSKNAKLNFVAKYTLNTAKTPTVIHMTVSEGARKGQVAHGILDMENAGRMRICYVVGDQGIPTEFATKPGGTIERMFILKRADLAPGPNDAAQQRVGPGIQQGGDATKDKSGAKNKPPQR